MKVFKKNGIATNVRSFVSTVALSFGALHAGECVGATTAASVQQAGDVEMRLIEAPTSEYERVVRSETPEGCPFAESSAFAGVGFTRRHAEYTDADTWYPSWAADGNLYSPWT